jgi:NADH:ubiquinone oxidoreductase subunit
MTTQTEETVCMNRIIVFASLIGLSLLIPGCSQVENNKVSNKSDRATRSEARLIFNDKGEAALPRGYSSWVHAATAWEPITTTLLDGTETKTPEFHNLYVEPTAYRGFMQTGKWPEGALMVKEFSFTSTEEKNCEGPPAYVCEVWFGKGIFQHGFIGIGVMLKDSKRYPNEPGGWVYFSYGHQTQPYKPFSPVRDRVQCAQCHIDRAGPAQDYVFSINQPGLSRNGSDAVNNLAAAFPD